MTRRRRPAKLSRQPSATERRLAAAMAREEQPSTTLALNTIHAAQADGEPYVVTVMGAALAVRLSVDRLADALTDPRLHDWPPDTRQLLRADLVAAHEVLARLVARLDHIP